MKFIVYKHQFELPSGALARRQLIALKHEDGSLTFTDFGKYVSRKAAFTTPENDGGPQFYYVVQMLNFVLEEYHIRTLNDLTVDMVQDFLQCYADGTLDEDTAPRQKRTVEACSNAILKFLINYIKANKNATITEKSLYKKEMYQDKHHAVKERKVPVFDVIVENSDKHMLREIPRKAFSIMLNYITEVHPDLLGLFILSAFAGLRPSEACNVRRENSPLGPGIMFTYIDDEIASIKIDLRKKMIIRSDGKITGGIKKPRLQAVPEYFLDSFLEMYEIYMGYLASQPYEEEYGALNLNRQGRAMMYRSYYNRFKDIMKNELGPVFRASEDHQVAEFGLALLTEDLTPHALRHWYSVELTLAGYSVPELMSARGDTSPESALTYLKNKGELEKQHQAVASEMFEYASWAAENKHGTK